MKSLEKIISELPDYVPKELVLLGSYSIIARIYLSKELDTDLYRDTKDIDLFMFPEDENEFLINGIYNQPFAGHYVVNVRDAVVELFSGTSLSDLVGEDQFVDFLLEKDQSGKYTHLDEMKINGRTIYVPKLPAIILMKTRSFGKRMNNTDKDRSDLAFIRGYLPTQYNNALNYLKQRTNEYPFIVDLLEKHSEMFNNQ